MPPAAEGNPEEKSITELEDHACKTPGQQPIPRLIFIKPTEAGIAAVHIDALSNKTSAARMEAFLNRAGKDQTTYPFKNLDDLRAELRIRVKEKADQFHDARKVAVAERIDAVYMSAAPTPQEKILDFDSTLAVADAFVGRETVFAALETFRTNYDRGYFDIVAEAGLGKTALAAAITRRREAICFFASANRGLKRADQFLTHASGALIVKYKLNYERLSENIGNDATFFTKVLRQAVTTLAPGDTLWLVADGLDEAEQPADKANPLLLPDELPKSAYIVVTRRPGPDLSTVANTPVERYTIYRDDADQESSIDAYLRAQAKPSSRVGQALAAGKPPIGVEEFVTRLKAGSERNFMYLSYVIEDIANRKPGDPPLEMRNLPKGLFGYYERFWSRLQEVKAAEGWADWNGLYRPVIERLGVAFEPVPAEWLSKQIGRSTDEVLERALERWRRLLGRERHNGTDGWRLVHRSFADFLATKVFDIAGEAKAVLRDFDRRSVVGAHSRKAFRRFNA